MNPCPSGDERYRYESLAIGAWGYTLINTVMKSWPVLLPETNSDHRMVLHFHVHHPRRLRAVSTPASPGQSQYFDDALTRTLITRMVEQCYLPVNDLLLTLIGRYPTL